MVNSRKILLFSLLFSILLSSLVLSLGVTPAKVQVAYEPGRQIEFDFTFSNYAYEVEFEGYGGLAEPGTIEVNPSRSYLDEDGYKKVTLKFTMAENARPGVQAVRLKGIGKAPKTYGLPPMAALPAIVTRIESVVPYPDKYPEIKFLSPDDVPAGEPMYFKVEFRNLGTKPIKFASGNVILINSVTNETVATVRLTGLANIPAVDPDADRKEFFLMLGEWDTKGVDVGKYSAQAFVTSDGTELESRTFDVYVGGMYVDVINISPSNLTTGKISSLNVRVKSIWNENIDFYLDVALKDGSGKTLSETKSPMDSVSQWAEKDVPVFMDLTKVSPGNYTVDVTANFGLYTSKGEFPLEVIPGDKFSLLENPEFFSEIPAYYLALIGAMALLFILVVFLAVLLIVVIFSKGHHRDEEEKEIKTSKVPKKSMAEIKSKLKEIDELKSRIDKLSK